MANMASERTREKLIRAAERLMAEHGITAVGLQEIQRAADQRNRSAIAYHFGDRDGLVEAIQANRRPALDQACGELLEQASTGGEPSVDDLVGALVGAQATCLHDESGRDYLIIAGERAARLGAVALLEAQAASGGNAETIDAMLLRRVGGSKPQRQLTVGWANLTIAVMLADVARAVNRDELSVRSAGRRADDATAFVAAALRDTAG